jgi:hypothetical protein
LHLFVDWIRFGLSVVFHLDFLAKAQQRVAVFVDFWFFGAG